MRDESYEEYDYYLTSRICDMIKGERNTPSLISKIEYDFLIKSDNPVAFLEMWNNRIIRHIKRMQAKYHLHFADVLNGYSWTDIEESIIHNKNYFEEKIYYYENFQAVENNENEYFESIGLNEGERYTFTAEYDGVRTELVEIGYDKYAYKKFIDFNNIRLDDCDKVLKKFTFACGKGFDNILSELESGDLVEFSATFFKLMLERPYDYDERYDDGTRFDVKGGLSRPTKIKILEKKQVISRRLAVA